MNTDKLIKQASESSTPPTGWRSHRNQPQPSFSAGRHCVEKEILRVIDTHKTSMCTGNIAQCFVLFLGKLSLSPTRSVWSAMDKSMIKWKPKKYRFVALQTTHRSGTVSLTSFGSPQEALRG